MRNVEVLLSVSVYLGSSRESKRGGLRWELVGILFDVRLFVML